MSKYIYDENVFLKIDNFDNIYFEEEKRFCFKYKVGQNRRWASKRVFLRMI